MRDEPPVAPLGLWRLRTTAVPLEDGPLVMGIVNVTPDSFSDGGRYFDPQLAVRHALELVEQGADLLDIGGESTRPYATPVDVSEELRRVVPVVEEVCRRTSVPVSIDTSKAVVAHAALDCGVEIINDVTGLESDAEMLPLARSTGAAVCVMHMRGTPATMQVDPVYEDVVEQVTQYLSERRDRLIAAGIEPARICLDPGIGFGKTHRHNLELLAHCRRLTALGCPILVGPSRKGFIGHVLGDPRGDRVAGTIGVALALAAQGVQILRVHDVRAVKQALQLFQAAGGLGRPGAWSGIEATEATEETER
jgi:dihydropteroate synthase